VAARKQKRMSAQVVEDEDYEGYSAGRVEVQGDYG
jgi:hypothetical protein